MPVLIRETPLGRALLEEGFREGLRSAGRGIVLDLTRLILRERFGDDPRVDDIGGRLAALADDGLLARLDGASSLDELRPDTPLPDDYFQGPGRWGSPA